MLAAFAGEIKIAPSAAMTLVRCHRPCSRKKRGGVVSFHTTPRLGLPCGTPRRFSHSGSLHRVRACRYSGDTLCGCPVLVSVLTPAPPVVIWWSP